MCMFLCYACVLDKWFYVKGDEFLTEISWKLQMKNAGCRFGKERQYLENYFTVNGISLKKNGNERKNKKQPAKYLIGIVFLSKWTSKYDKHI